MKYLEINTGLRVPVSNEEMQICTRVREHGEPMPRSAFNTREREVARGLVHRGVLDRVQIDEQLYFVYNELEDLWS